MSIEQHTGPARQPDPTLAPADADAALARLLHGLTTAVLALPTETFEVRDTEPTAERVEPNDAPARERRTGSLLAELTFLDD